MVWATVATAAISAASKQGSAGGGASASAPFRGGDAVNNSVINYPAWTPQRPGVPNNPLFTSIAGDKGADQIKLLLIGSALLIAGAFVLKK